MSYAKTIVCLANSKKHGGRCIAGKEALATEWGPWVRPVSARKSNELYWSERLFPNNEEPKLLDVVTVHLKKPAPWSFQTENHVMELGRRLEKEGELAWGELARVADRPETLWTNGDQSRKGLNDRVRSEEADGLNWSLALIKPERLSILVREEGARYGEAKIRVRADFAYNGTRYMFSVTDPVVCETFGEEGPGDYAVPSAYLCVSLGEPYSDGYCYKLVASVFAPEFL